MKIDFSKDRDFWSIMIFVIMLIFLCLLLEVIEPKQPENLQVMKSSLNVESEVLPSNFDVRVITFQGCQYVVATESFGASAGYGLGITHKGNCANHKK